MYEMESKADIRVGVGAKTRATTPPGGIGLHTHWHIECYDKQGRLKWVEDVDNLVVNVGLDDVLSQYFKGVAYTAAFYVGLTDSAPTFVAGDTMAAHAGWVEVVAYDEVTREVLTLGAVAGQSVDNSANAAQFTISANNTTIGGAFVTTDNTKGGAAGTLYGGAVFTAGDKTLDDDDTIDVTVTLTAAAA